MQQLHNFGKAYVTDHDHDQVDVAAGVFLAAKPGAQVVLPPASK